MTRAARLLLVREAIERIKVCEREHLVAQCDPQSSQSARDQAQERFHQAEREFGWQWRNVSEVLEGL